MRTQLVCLTTCTFHQLATTGSTSSFFFSYTYRDILMIEYEIVMIAAPEMELVYVLRREQDLALTTSHFPAVYPSGTNRGLAHLLPSPR